MNLETQSQIDDLTELRETHRRRLKQLRLMLATTGTETPASIPAEIDAIEGKIYAIERQIGMLHKAEAAWALRLLPAEQGAAASTEADTEKQLEAIARYVFSLEDSVHRDVGAIFHLIEQETQLDNADRKRRQKQFDIRVHIIITLLIVLIVVVALK